jgi:metal-responsive CopG/Arc/MetJ family transcriptional regulator
MHMHVAYPPGMRTTVELRDEHRAALLELAGRRGLKGFSDLVGEAIEAYLHDQARMNENVNRALRAQGALDQQEADDLRSRVSNVRTTWRGGSPTTTTTVGMPEARK